ncbi:unnamed protein product [Kuraishia capsulata CBS 1993]|uniref:Major facilitator superfamily (MFS) profile domain-containing protein n=1 Tax=Kuraishia capsulata CBS 1993 TaxID=1382522 RepID=W6MFY0_9ASCO|nr:uncharacterized protein KUCA_T00000831001 [Kuraishia capsulata CBS 1993]CDK24864.1 unnamed protein product [Kuraishia capsulata CBS 1993]
MKDTTEHIEENFHDNDIDIDASSEKGPVVEEEVPLMEQLKAARGVIKYMAIIFAASIGIGIDSMVFSLMLGLESFRKEYGYWNEASQGWVIKAVYQSGWNGGSQGTQIVGSLFAGQFSDMIGRRYTLCVAAIIAIVAAVIEVTAKNAAVLVAGKCIMGLGTGVLVTVVPPYLSELSPPKLRGYAAIGINFSICFGQFLAAITVMGCSRSYPGIDDNRAYKVSLSVQFILVSVFLLVSPVLPESPALLVQRGKIDKARDVLHKIYGENTGYDLDGHLDLLVAQVQKETIEKEHSKNISYLEVFKGIQFWRLLIVTAVLTGQQWVGFTFVLPYINYFFENAGISSSNEKTVGVMTIAVGGNMLSYVLLEKIPRRKLFVYGVMFLGICNLLTGSMSLASSSASGYVLVVFICLWSFVYQFAIGSNAYAIMVEIPSSRLVPKTVAVASNVNSLIGFGLGYLIPFLYNPDEVNMGLKIMYVWFGTSVVLFVFVLFFLPESKNRTALEMDQMFEEHVNPLYFDKVQFTVDGDLIQSTAVKGYTSGYFAAFRSKKAWLTKTDETDV